jgi:alpha-ketoglutarate-dependent taurine dioxygenase
MLIFLDALDYAKEVCEETAVEITWQKGDVALIDNFLVMHARRDYDGNRRVLASLVK